MLSGIAGVYFEKTLKAKDGRVSVWVRNVQLSFYSIWPALFLGVAFMDGEHFAKTGFFAGYNWVVWIVIALQALGGVIIGLALNYTDGITKGLATSASAAVVVVFSALLTEASTAGMVR
jgi:UDP-galactose transporter